MIWYTPTDKRDVRYMPADIALYGINPKTSAVWYTPTDKCDVWHMPVDIVLYGIHLHTSTARYTPADIVLYDMVYTYRQARCMVHVRRHSAVWHTPADKRCTVYACRHSSV